jgi:hypothetical protein
VCGSTGQRGHSSDRGGLSAFPGSRERRRQHHFAELHQHLRMRGSIDRAPIPHARMMTEPVDPRQSIAPATRGGPRKKIDAAPGGFDSSVRVDDARKLNSSDGDPVIWVPSGPAQASSNWTDLNCGPPWHRTRPAGSSATAPPRCAHAGCCRSEAMCRAVMQIIDAGLCHPPVDRCTQVPSRDPRSSAYSSGSKKQSAVAARSRSHSRHSGVQTIQQEM